MGRAWPRLTYLRAADQEPTDEQLAAAASVGDWSALEGLFARYEGPLVRCLQRLVRDSDTAVDLFHDAFLRAYVNLRAYDPRRPFRPWLYRIATNTGLDWLRHRVRALPPFAADGPAPVATVVAARQLSQQVEEAVTELSEDHRTVVLLRHYEGLSYAEIAEVTGSPEGTVRSRMHYALRALRRKLRYLMEEQDHDAL